MFCQNPLLTILFPFRCKFRIEIEVGEVSAEWEIILLGVTGVVMIYNVKYFVQFHHFPIRTYLKLIQSGGINT